MWDEDRAQECAPVRAVELDAGNDRVEVVFDQTAQAPLRLSRFGPRGRSIALPAGQPFVEIMTVDSGHLGGTSRMNRGAASAALRYVGHRTRHDESTTMTWIDLEDVGRLQVTVRIEVPDGAVAFRSVVSVRNSGGGSRALLSVTSAVFRVALGPHAVTSPDDLRVSSAASDWIGESRWSTVPLRDRLPDLRAAAHDHCDARGSFSLASRGAWSTDGALPVGILETVAGGENSAIVWQIEHNGGWRWELGETAAGVSVGLAGPTDLDHQWLLPLGPGDLFETVPATIAMGDGVEGAVAELTRARRMFRRPHPDARTRPVIFNDYMNTVRGDPSASRLLPLIDAAAEVGAEVFCIDAGWHDDSTDWWSLVGEWLPSSRRFPDGGLAAVIEHIRSRGMVPGLWLEPEVVGVRSPVAERLPIDAFLQRGGERVVELQRYNLDLRHPAAVAHLDEVIDRLVADFGIGYFKLDYNIDPGPGTDVSGTSAGVGLLEHNRAHLDWLDSVLDRHPGLVLENCASGAMRQDFALLSRLQLQSTSDQQSADAYPAIAASAPLIMLPEQAANWAYPQPEMTDEQIAFTLCTTMLGRFYLSGFLDRMSEPQRELVAHAVTAHRSIRSLVAEGTAGWPLGISQWDSSVPAMTIETDDTCLLVLWRRHDGPASIDVPLRRYRGAPLEVRTLFPMLLASWDASWDEGAGVLRIRVPVDGMTARVFRLDRQAVR